MARTTNTYSFIYIVLGESEPESEIFGKIGRSALGSQWVICCRTLHTITCVVLSSDSGERERVNKIRNKKRGQGSSSWTFRAQKGNDKVKNEHKAHL